MQKINSVRLKKTLLVSTITLFATSAVLGVLFVLVGTNEIGWKIEGSVAILALLSLLSMNNVFRLDAKAAHVRVLSTVALLANVFWVLPSLLVIWDVFETLFCGQTVVTTSYGYTYTACSEGYSILESYVTKTILTSGIVAIVATIASNFLAIIRYTTVITVLCITTVASASVLGLYVLPAIWSEEGEYIGDSWRFLVIVSIIFVFGAIVAPVLAKIARAKAKAPYQRTMTQEMLVDEAKLRAEIEAKVRAEIAAEQPPTMKK